MLSRVLKTISRYNMLPQGARVIVAVSGGADSVCLLHVLKELAPDSVAGIAHFNHKWRAEASDEDERFVATLAAQFALPFFRTETGSEPEPGNREQNARRARQKFFRGLPHTIALGHTQDDQAETVLFRLLRGSGLAGLAGIAPVTEGIIRPLLNITRAEIEQFLQARCIPWRDDATNSDLSFSRNRIRHQLLPQLTSEWNPEIKRTLAHLSDLAREEESCWTQEIDRQAAQFLIIRAITNPPPLVGRAFMPAAALEAALSPLEVELQSAALNLPRAIARRLIRRAISIAKGDLRRIEFHHIEAVFDLQRRLVIPGVTVTRSFDWLHFASHPAAAPPPALEITPPGVFPAPDGLTRICVDLTQKACATLKVEASQVCSHLQLRGWRPGDRYRPQGHSQDHKIQEMFQKARIPSWRRASWPILTNGDQILWSRQFGVAEEFSGMLRVSEITLS